MAITDVVSAPASPWQNPYVERLITHLGLEKDAPDHRPVSGTSNGPIVAIPEVGGLHHRYERRAA
jgi:hypothetical protein